MSQPGTYALLLHLEVSRSIVVGALGALDFPAGWYVYVGSAHGPGGLAARLARHRRKTDKRLHWHVDYVRAVTRLAQVWTSAREEHQECEWAAAVAALPGARRIARGLGASDCRCASHLFHFSGLPDRRQLESLIQTKLEREDVNENSA